MQITQDFLSSVPGKKHAHSGLCKRFLPGAIGRKNKQDAQVISAQVLRSADDESVISEAGAAENKPVSCRLLCTEFYHRRYIFSIICIFRL